MTENTRKIAIADPRSFEGDPYEVAQRAVHQIAGLVGIVEDSIEPAKLMARNAALERQLDLDQALDAAGWDGSPEGRRWTKIEGELDSIKRDLRTLAKVVEFNPKKAR